MAFDKFHIEGDDGIRYIINRELHRYQSIDQHLLNSLKGNYLWFSNPEKFNDPYDCNLDFDFENTPQEIDAYLTEINNRPENAYHKKNDIELQTLISRYINEPGLLSKTSRDQSVDAINKIGICCFSESDDKLLMWSHYGNKHKGACLTFDIIEHKELFLKFPYCVEYPPRYPKINWIRESGLLKSRRFELATKSLEWSYEEEVRIIRDDTKPPYSDEVRFNKKSLKAIKFGYKSNIGD